MTDKYHIDETHDTREVIAMLIIANELAESKRLKRLEMDLKILYYRSKLPYSDGLSDRFDDIISKIREESK